MKFIGYIVVLAVFATVNSQGNYKYIPQQILNKKFWYSDACPEGEVKVSCKNDCQPTCLKPTPPLLKCSACKEGCVCQQHLIRDTKYGRCIPASECQNRSFLPNR